MGKRYRVLIVGAGGHGRVVADSMQSMRSSEIELQPIGYLDDDESLLGSTPLGLPVLGVIDDVAKVEHDAVVVAIGNNDLRRRLFADLVERGDHLVSVIHNSATISSEVAMGIGAMVCAGVVVNIGSRIGDNVILNTGCIIEHDCNVGNHAHIAPGVTLGGDVTIGRGTLVGLGATILRGVTVGDDCIIGAGAVVTKNISNTSVVAGIPARNMHHYS